ncbi:30S ribosomal protein S6 [Fodinisporobacter ferrooxydans]|uniref:Small ribosomal subunit protein bS6 n=1 Tax=Fodinisporobacter ferrooxydans TaxID=2901836 RepID=A0ABY4CJL0_9BACL|nr:30S ribosomal protein S6 [Alicyclobacillaceae bacterium MYW30-H2]
MKAYETMIVFKTDIEEELRDSLIEKFEQVIVKTGGTVEKTERLGKRRLAYEIGHNREGFYLVFHYTAAAQTPAELERNLKIEERIIRYLTTVRPAA